jgi:Uma2 family endonuclease
MHQDVSVQLVVEFGSYLRGKKCKVYHPPFDVILPEEGETLETAKNIVQPDIFVVCDKDKITPGGCYGAPDLVVEILSPSTAKRDIKDKRKLYQRAGVREYWIVDPVHKTVHVYKVDEEGKYSFPETYTEDDKIKVGIFNDEQEIDLSVVFI